MTEVLMARLDEISNFNSIFELTDAATVDVDPANGSIQTWTLANNRTATFENFLSGWSVTLMLTGGGNTVTWPTVRWVGGNEPVLLSTGTDIIELWRVGSDIFGAYAGNA